MPQIFDFLAILYKEYKVSVSCCSLLTHFTLQENYFENHNNVFWIKHFFFSWIDRVGSGGGGGRGGGGWWWWGGGGELT